MSDETAIQPLRIVSIVNVPWDARLGAARVWMELGREWAHAGNFVEKYCLTDAYPNPTSSPRLAALRLLLFPRKAAAFVRTNADRFDVVDCLIGTLPFTKKSLRFGGLVVARSVGLFHSYEKFERVSPQRLSSSRSARLFYGVFRKRELAASRKSLRCADLLNVPNEDERVVLREELHSEVPAIVQPYGLQPEQRQAFSAAAAPDDERQRNKQVCFLGMWSARKGARDWAEIIRFVRARHPDAQFLFLGTMVQDAAVFQDLGVDAKAFVRIVPHYQQAELPRLLANATVGAFPSYIEGFGIAVIEKLAAGLPVVAYNCPGPRDILSPRLRDLLIPAGDAPAFGEKLADILAASPEQYRSFATASRETAARFLWPQIARDTLDDYRACLAEIKSRHAAG